MPDLIRHPWIAGPARDDTAMKITLNGESRTVEANATLADFIASLGEQPQALATAIAVIFR